MSLVGVRRPWGCVVTGLALLLTGAGCGGRDAQRRSCLLEVAAAPDGAWVRQVRVEGERVRLELADGTVRLVPVRPRRIVSTLPSLTELVAYLVGLDALVGVSPWCDTPPEVSAKDRLSVMPLDVERLRSLAPDLVLCDATFQAGSVPLLEEHAAALLPLESRSLPHLFTTLDVLATVFATPEARARAETLVRELKAAEAQVRGAAQFPPPRVLLVGQSDPLHVLGPGSLLDDLLRACGCVNAACDLGRASGPFGEEAVLARAPDWILTTGDDLPEALRRRWSVVPALVHGRVAPAWAHDLVRGGPRTPAALRRLAAVLRGALPPRALAESP